MQGMSGFEKMIIAAIVGACVALISILQEKSKIKKLLSRCVADEACINTFEYKDAKYSKDKYIEIKMQDYSKVKPKDLKKMVDSYNKSFEKGKLNQLQILDFNAMKRVLNNN